MSFSYSEISRNGYEDAKGIRHYTRVFKVLSTNPNTGPLEVTNVVPLTRWNYWACGSESDPYAYLKSKRADMVGENFGKEWLVTCEYDSEPFGSASGDSAADGDSAPGASDQSVPPDDRPWMVDVGSNKVSLPWIRDITNDLPLKMSNGQVPDPPLELPHSLPVYTLSGWKAYNDDGVGNKQMYEDTVNSADYTFTVPGIEDVTIAAGTGRVADYHLETVYEHGAWYWKKKVVIEVNTINPYMPTKFLDVGSYEVVGGVRRTVYDPQGNPMTQVPLDGFGQRLLPGNDPVYRSTYVGYKSVSWAGLI